MRLVLALLAILGLLTAPVTAAMAQATCGQAPATAPAGPTMQAMPGPDHAGAETASADPCCDHGDQHGKTMNAACAQACATTCGVTVAMAGCAEHVVFIASRATLAPAPVAQSHPYEPPGLKRPPRLIG